MNDLGTVGGPVVETASGRIRGTIIEGVAAFKCSAHHIPLSRGRLRCVRKGATLGGSRHRLGVAHVPCVSLTETDHEATIWPRRSASLQDVGVVVDLPPAAAPRAGSRLGRVLRRARG